MIETLLHAILEQVDQPKKDLEHNLRALLNEAVSKMDLVSKDEPFDKHNGELWGWNPFKVKSSGRFGGGWAFKFGITSNENFRELIIDVGIGSIRLEIMNSRRGFRA